MAKPSMNVLLESHDSEAPAIGRSKASKAERHSGVELRAFGSWA